MPDGRTHAAITVTGASLSLLGALRFPAQESLLLCVGFLVTLFVNPDLDLNTRFPRSPSRWLWWLYWWPYSRLIAHRGILSHGPILGTALRVIYLLAPLYLAGFRITIPWYLFVGMVASDALHSLADVLSTSLKRAI